MYIKSSQQFVVPQKSQYFFWIKLWLVVFEMSSIRQFQTHRQINEEKNKDHIHFTPHNTISSSKSSTSVIYRPVSLINVIDTSSSYDLLTECDMASLSWCKLMGIYIYRFYLLINGVIPCSFVNDAIWYSIALKMVEFYMVRNFMLLTDGDVIKNNRVGATYFKLEYATNVLPEPLYLNKLKLKVNQHCIHWELFRSNEERAQQSWSFT